MSHTNNTQPHLPYITGHTEIREYTKTHSSTTQHTSHSQVSLVGSSASSPDHHIVNHQYMCVTFILHVPKLVVPCVTNLTLSAPLMSAP